MGGVKRAALAFFVLLIAFSMPFAAWGAPGMESILALWRQGNIEGATRQMGEFLHAHPSDFEAWNEYGVMRLGRGELGKAEEAFARALLLRPGYSSAALNFGNLLRHEGRMEDALECLTTGLAWNGKDVPLLIGRGQLHAQMGDWSAAREDLQKALSLSPRNPLVLNELAWLLSTCPAASCRDGQKAAVFARMALEETPGMEPGLLDTLAAAEAEKGNFEEAARIERAAVSAALELGFAREALDSWYERLGLYALGLPYRQPAEKTLKQRKEKDVRGRVR